MDVEVVLSLDDLSGDDDDDRPPPPTHSAPSASPDRSCAEKEMVVARRLADVFAVISEFEAYPTWVAGLQQVEVLERDGESGLGTLVRFTAGAMGLSISYTLAYTTTTGTAGGGRVLSWRSVAGGVKSIVGSYELTPASEESTRVQYRLDVDTGFKMPAMLRRTATSLVIGAALPDLKRHLEAGLSRRLSWF